MVSCSGPNPQVSDKRHIDNVLLIGLKEEHTYAAQILNDISRPLGFDISLISEKSLLSQRFRYVSARHSEHALMRYGKPK